MPGAYTVRPEGIIRQPALTMPGNATGSEAACTALNASSIRTLLSLSTVSDVTFDIVRATTSVQTPLVNNASAALTLGNSTYGVTVPGDMSINGGILTLGVTNSQIQFANSVGSAGQVLTMFGNDFYVDNPNPTGNIYFRPGGSALALTLGTTGVATFSGAGSFTSSSEPTLTLNHASDPGLIFVPTGNTSHAWKVKSSAGAFYIQHATSQPFGGTVRSDMEITTGGSVNFFGDISMQKATQGYIRAYATDGVKNAALYHDGTNGRISTSSGYLGFQPVNGNTVLATSAVQSRLYVYDSTLAKSAILTHDGTTGILTTDTGNGSMKVTSSGGNTILSAPTGYVLAVSPVDGVTNFAVTGTQSKARVYNSVTDKYSELTHDGTNGILSTSSGAVEIAAASSYTNFRTSGFDAALIIYSSGSARNMQLTQGGTVGTISSTGSLRLTSGVTGIEFRPFGGYAEQWTSGSDGQYNVFNSAGSKRIQLKFTGSGVTEGGYITANTKLFVDIASTTGVMVFGQAGNTSDPGLKRGGVGILSARYGDDSGDCAFTCAGITASGTITTGGSTTGQVYINQTAGAVVWGVDLQYAGSSRAFFDANGSTGETRIGGSYSSFYPVIYSGGSPCLTFNTSGHATFASRVAMTSGLSTGTVTKSANYTTTADDYCVNVTANSIDITFETAVGCANREHEVINSGSGVVTLKTTSAQTISGNASGALTLAQWKSIRVKSDGSNWLIMSQIT